MQQLSKAIAREIQANPEALNLVKSKNMEMSINKTAEIELQDDIVSQYVEAQALFAEIALRSKKSKLEVWEDKQWKTFKIIEII